MTRLLVLSDLHQNDGGRSFDPASEITTPFDIAIIAGDCAGRLTASLKWLGERFAGVPTIYVPGNHDWYRDGAPNGFTVEDELQAGRDLAARLGITLLSDEAATINGLTVLGATLWTDLRSHNHVSRAQAHTVARRGMNDYRCIHRASSTRRSRRITPATALAWHRASCRFLADAFAGGIYPCRTVVVTHHAPSLRSLARRTTRWTIVTLRTSSLRSRHGGRGSGSTGISMQSAITGLEKRGSSRTRLAVPMRQQDSMRTGLWI